MLLGLAAFRVSINRSLGGFPLYLNIKYMSVVTAQDIYQILAPALTPFWRLLAGPLCTVACQLCILAHLRSKTKEFGVG